MILVYSKEQTNIKGKHIDPEKFSGMPSRIAKEIYTNDGKIKSIYEKIGAKVNQLPKVDKLKADGKNIKDKE